METTVAEEKEYNPRLSKTLEEFVEIMNGLNLPYPKQIGELDTWSICCADSALIALNRFKSLSTRQTNFHPRAMLQASIFNLLHPISCH